MPNHTVALILPLIFILSCVLVGVGILALLSTVFTIAVRAKEKEKASGKKFYQDIKVLRIA